MSEPRELPPEVRERPGGLLSRLDQHLVLYHEPRNLHAEQYRAFRTNLIALNREHAPWAMVVTSSRTGEGKSITAANLAACLAELPSERVCLVDTDFRRPAQAAIFGVDAVPGVSELLAERASLQDVLHTTVLSNLELIMAGEQPPNPAEVLGSERFRNLLSELKRRYSWIVLDSPPVHPYTDACLLSSVTNGAIIVVRMEETERELAQRTIDSVKRAGGAVLGTFLSGLTPDRDDADRQGYYRTEATDATLLRHDAERRRARKRAEKRLREQEKAYLKRLGKRKDEPR